MQESDGAVADKSLIEIVPTHPAITLHFIPPGEGRNYLTVFTSGMSALPMTVPVGGEDYQYAELFMQLPADWKYMDITSEESWPLHKLRYNARYVHQAKTWLGGPYCLIYNDPPEPLASNTKMTALLALASANEFTNSAGNFVRFYQLFPLYTDEVQLETAHGGPALMNALDKAGVSMVVDINRPSVV